MTDQMPRSGAPARRLYGRRKGPALSPRQTRLMEKWMPRLGIDPERCQSAGDLDPVSLFDRRFPDVWLEIGFGKGEHFLWQSGRHPETGFIGCEPYINGVAAVTAAFDQQPRDNLRLWPDDARLLIHALRAASIGRVFILHPDPWPKRRHAKRRIINPSFLDDLSRTMRPGAELRIATDQPVFRQWVLAQMAARADFDWRVRHPADWRERPDDWPETRYGSKATDAGRRPVYLRYHKL